MIFLLIILTTHINVSYASFPVSDTLKVNRDTLQTESIKQYHSNLIKMGIDLNDCKCKSCRNGIFPLTINGENKEIVNKNTMQRSGATGLYILSGLILLGVIVWFSIGLIRAYNCLDTGDDCGQSSGGPPKHYKLLRGAPIELLWMGLLVLISAGVAVKARFIQLRNKRRRLK